MGTSKIADQRSADDSVARVAKETHAVFIANYPSGSPEWHALRATGIGGSEVGTICGLNKWESAYRLWAVKTGQIEESFTPNEAMEWGTRLESVILDKFADSHENIKLHRNVGTWHHPDREWQLANPDAIFEQYVGEDPDLGEDQKLIEFGIVEVKTAQYEDDWKDGVPAYYRTQVQWYLSTFGFQRAYVIVLFHGNRYREFEIMADEFEQSVHLERVHEFRVCVECLNEPEWDGSLSTYQTVREMHPEITDEQVEIGWLGIEYFSAEIEAKRAEDKLTEIKSRVMSAMGTAKRGLINGEWRFTRQAKSGGSPYLVAKRQ